VSAALRHTPTWMATAAKAGMAYPRPFWREAGHSGNAWVTHPQAVLAEVFDASTPAQTDAASPDTPSSHAALAGFSALGASARPQFGAVGMALLLRSQLGQLFGAEAQDGELHTLDWALEPHTCSPLDLAEDSQPLEHPSYGEPLLTQPHWQGRLLFGGSETARQGGGYVEGALSAAARLRRELLQAPAAANPEPLARARA
jgi:monoamine oxidase